MQAIKNRSHESIYIAIYILFKTVTKTYDTWINKLLTFYGHSFFEI